MDFKPLPDIDVCKRFGLENYLDMNMVVDNGMVGCYLCFLFMCADDVEEHVHSEYHQTLLKVTKKCHQINSEALKQYNSRKQNAESEDKQSKSEDFDENKENLASNTNDIIKEPLPLADNKEPIILSDTKDPISLANNTTSNTEKSSEDMLLIPAAAKSIDYNKLKQVAHCSWCKVAIVAEKKVLNEHINTLRHKSRAESDDAPEFVTIEVEKFVVSIQWYFNGFEPIAVVNRNIVISLNAVMLILLKNNSWECPGCCKNLKGTDPKTHLMSDTHIARVTSDVVVINEEFIREIRTDVFHCALCNKVTNGWSLMRKHLKSSGHSWYKGRAMEFLDDIEGEEPIIEHCYFAEGIGTILMTRLFQQVLF